MKASCCGVGALGIIMHTISRIIEVIVTVICYTGLYWPMFYLLVILGMWASGAMTFEMSRGVAA